jgi:hypothetical protein
MVASGPQRNKNVNKRTHCIVVDHAPLILSNGSDIFTCTMARFNFDTWPFTQIQPDLRSV